MTRRLQPPAEPIRLSSALCSREDAAAAFFLATLLRFPPRLVAYSYLSAEMGSSRDAFSAGQIPKKRPTPVATLKPAITDQRGTVEGRLGTNVRMARLSSRPP